MERHSAEPGEYESGVRIFVYLTVSFFSLGLDRGINGCHSYITYLSFAAVAVHRQRKRAANGSERLGDEAYELGAGKGS